MADINNLKFQLQQVESIISTMEDNIAKEKENLEKYKDKPNLLAMTKDMIAFAEKAIVDNTHKKASLEAEIEQATRQAEEEEKRKAAEEAKKEEEQKKAEEERKAQEKAAKKEKTRSIFKAVTGIFSKKDKTKAVEESDKAQETKASSSLKVEEIEVDSEPFDLEKMAKQIEADNKARMDAISKQNEDIRQMRQDYHTRMMETLNDPRIEARRLANMRKFEEIKAKTDGWSVDKWIAEKDGAQGAAKASAGTAAREGAGETSAAATAAAIKAEVDQELEGKSEAEAIEFLSGKIKDGLSLRKDIKKEIAEVDKHKSVEEEQK